MRDLAAGAIFSARESRPERIVAQERGLRAVQDLVLHHTLSMRL